MRVYVHNTHKRNWWKPPLLLPKLFMTEGVKKCDKKFFVTVFSVTEASIINSIRWLNGVNLSL